MRAIILFALLVSGYVLRAQSFMPGSFYDNTYRGSTASYLHPNDSSLNKKWSLTRYSAVSTSFAFFRGANATVFSAPVGLQLNRRLNDNLSAFAGVSIAPTYVNFNRSFISDDFKANQQNTFYRSGNFGLYSRAELGLQYINDEKTFSISGSISVGRTNYPVLQYNPAVNPRTAPIIPGSW